MPNDAIEARVSTHTSSHVAVDVLRLDAEVLLHAAERFDGAAFDKAVELVLGASGKAILTGAGTSGILARKIAATLTSTGTPAIFLHPSDALHGGLGAVEEDDVVIALSNGGETEELLAIIPYLRHRNVRMIAITGNLTSSLARAADVSLEAFAQREAGPLGLAPTSSGVLALAIGDALAMALLERHGLTSEDFALNHPSGRLGRRLTLRVADVTQDRLPSVGPEAPLLDVVSAISEGGLGACVVVDGDDRLLGIVTDGDVRRAVQRAGAESISTLPASAVMTADPTSVEATTLAYDALQRMEDRASQISVLPVLGDDGRCVGLVRVHDIVRAGV